MFNFPDDLKVYKHTVVFDQSSLPQALTCAHSTKAGTWGRIRVISGKVRYVITGEAPDQHYLLYPGNDGLITPMQQHYVELLSAESSFLVEFMRSEVSPEISFVSGVVV